MKVKHEYVYREIMGERLLVPIGETVKQQNGLFTFNESAGFLWERLPAAETPRDLVDALLAEYEVDEPTAEQAVTLFLDILKEHDVL